MRPKVLRYLVSGPICSWLLLWSVTLPAQPVLIDEAVEADGLICFPVYGDSLQYKYLPSRGRLALNDEGLPEFSYLRYAVEKRDAEPAGRSVTEADGGGVVHFLVLYDTPEEQVRRAERELRTKLRRRDLTLTGPVPFSRGTYLLISSILRDGKQEKTLLCSGEAPVFENSRVAFSFPVSVRQAQLLTESFRMATPDISVMFDLQFSGLTRAFQGELIVDWAMVEAAEYSKQSVDAIFYSSDTEEMFGELTRTGAIQLKTAGKDTLAEELLQAAYDRLLKMMFEPVKPEMLPSEKTTGFLQDIFGRHGLIGGSNVYKKRVIQTSGRTVVNINTRGAAERHHFVTFNIGDLYQKYGDNPRFFRDVALDDPTFQQRQVLVNLDGSLAGEFDKMVNSVSITLRKTHENGAQTLREVFLNREMLKNYDGRLSMTYLNQQDKDRIRWLDYDYQINWQFKRDGGYVTPWSTANSPVFNLFTPYQYREITLDGDLDGLRGRGVRAVALEIEYPFFGKTKKDRLTLKLTDPAPKNQLEAVLPLDVETVDYRLTWIFADGKTRQASGQDRYGLIFIDEIPE